MSKISIDLSSRQRANVLLKALWCYTEYCEPAELHTVANLIDVVSRRLEGDITNNVKKVENNG